jgi:hemerythrin-like metal-binding protein
MLLIEWYKTYELGILEIDDHHRKLVDLLNKTYNMILCPTVKNEIHEILNELLNYTEYHFTAEEQIMKAARYTVIKTHVTKHNIFKKQLSELMHAYHSGKPHLHNDVVLFLWYWLKNHILKDDKELTDYMSRI